MDIMNVAPIEGGDPVADQAGESLAGLVERQADGEDGARAVLAQAIERFPGKTGLLHDLARLHEADRNWPEAERCWRAFVTHDPRAGSAFVGLANALVEQGRVGEGETVLTEQFDRIGEAPTLFIAHAHLAERRSNWEDAEQRWSAVKARFPNAREGHAGQIRSLRRQHRLTEARRLLTSALGRFGACDELLLEAAGLAESEDDWSAAARAWQALIARDQRPFWFYARLYQAECKQGRIEAALATFTAARERFPSQPNLVVDFARGLFNEAQFHHLRNFIAEAVGSTCDLSADDLAHLERLALICNDVDCAAAVARRLRALSPDDVVDEQVDAIERGGGAPAAETVPDAPVAYEQEADATDILAADDPAEAIATTPTMALMARFESLGGDEAGWEFGFLQRHFGAEPPGLLRWTSAPPEQLIEAIRTRFEVGSRDQTELLVDDDGFYRARDKRFEMDIVTFCRASDVALGDMVETTLRLLSGLREAMISDLARSDKIFVYRTLDDTMGLADVRRLKAAMSQYGPNRLLYMRRADPEHPGGSITIDTPGLGFGYVEAFGAGTFTEACLAGWHSVLEQADADWTVTQPDWHAGMGKAAEPVQGRVWLRRAAGLFRSRGRR